jgi:hypothetical protein
MDALFTGLDGNCVHLAVQTAVKSMFDILVVMYMKLRFCGFIFLNIYGLHGMWHA